MEKSQATLMRDRPNSKPVIVAAIAAGLLLLVLGTAHRGIAALVNMPVSPMPIDPNALKGLPMQMGDWTGEDVSLDDAIVRGTDTDAHLSRRYVRRGGSESIALYIACGVHVSRLMAHRPEICYDRAGWTLLDSRSAELPMHDGPQLPCDILRFSRDKPQAGGVAVLHYWIADGQWYSGVSHLDSKLWTILRTVDYVAHIQISASTPAFSPEAGARLVADFAADSGAPITRLFQDIEKVRSAGMSGGDLGGK